MKTRRLCWTCALLLLNSLSLGACEKPRVAGPGDSLPTPELLETHCGEMVGQPRVDRISEHVWAAIGFDIATTVLVHTPEGNVIVDVSCSPAEARAIRA